MTRLFPHASNSEVIAAVSNKPRRCPPSDTERLIPVRVSITSFSRVTLEIVWRSFQSPECFAVLPHMLFSNARTFRPRFCGEVGTGWIRGTRDRDEEREERGVSSVSETLCHGLDEEMKSAASIRRWAKIKASPTLSHMVLFDQCFAFPSLLFSWPLSSFSSFLRAGLLFFSPSEIPPRYWGNDVVARKVRGLRKPNLPQILGFTLVSPTFPPFSCTLFHVSLSSWSCV